MIGRAAVARPSIMIVAPLFRGSCQPVPAAVVIEHVVAEHAGDKSTTLPRHFRAVATLPRTRSPATQRHRAGEIVLDELRGFSVRNDRPARARARGEIRIGLSLVLPASNNTVGFVIPSTSVDDIRRFGIIVHVTPQITDCLDAMRQCRERFESAAIAWPPRRYGADRQHDGGDAAKVRDVVIAETARRGE